VPDPVMPAPLENVHEPDNIALYVGMGIFQGIPDPGLGCQVDHTIEFFIAEEPCNHLTVADVTLYETKVFLLFKAVQPGVLQADIIVVVDVIKTDDRRPIPDQPFRQMETYETGCSGYQNFTHFPDTPFTYIALHHFEAAACLFACLGCFTEELFQFLEISADNLFAVDEKCGGSGNSDRLGKIEMFLGKFFD
jgi:hypothetical protein